MRKYALVAYDRNRAIGAAGDIPWAGKMKTDIQRVKELTSGNAIIMGRKTYDSIGHALPNRQNIVITHRPFVADDVTVVDTVQHAYDAVLPDRDAIIFGGGQIYELAMNTIDEVVATEIDTTVENADAFFPPLGSEWMEVSREHHDADTDNAFAFDFVVYKKSLQ
jgi:dihydrofolate reductase